MYKTHTQNNTRHRNSVSLASFAFIDRCRLLPAETQALHNGSIPRDAPSLQVSQFGCSKTVARTGFMWVQKIWEARATCSELPSNS